MESIIEIVLIVSLFPLGILIGYRWRDRLSKEHRAQYLVERLERRQREGFMRESEQRSRRDIPSISEAIVELVEIKALEEA